MMRRLLLVVFSLLLSASAASARWNARDRQYLEDQFRLLREQLETMKAQVERLSAQVAALQQNQAQVQPLLERQQETVHVVSEMVSAIRVGNEETFTHLRATLAQMQKEIMEGFERVSPTLGDRGPEGKEPRPTLRGYVIDDSQPDTVTVNVGARNGLRLGSRLAVFKANDPETRAGVLEVTQVEEESSRARIVTMVGAARPQFGDVVRPD